MDRHHFFVVPMLERDEYDTRGKRQIRQVDTLSHLQLCHVDFDGFRQLADWGLDLDFRQRTMQQTASHLHSPSGLFVTQMHRHIQGHQLALMHAHEVHMEDLILVGMHLQVANQHAFLAATQLQGDDVAVYLFIAKKLVGGKDVQADGFRRLAVAINDRRDPARTAQAPAVTAPFFTACLGSKDKICFGH